MMNLFKRILLSFFPEDMVNQPVNPASMFVSFVSPRQFFSVINRKIVENYKLNLFDISLDSFDVKIGFGDEPSIKMHDIDFYYGYGCVANLNGYRFFSCSNVSMGIALSMSIFLKESFVGQNKKYFSGFIIAIYLISFIFLARIKVFPNESQESDYKWFIQLFFEFYKLLLIQNGQTIELQMFETLKNKILGENIQIFFTLFYYYKNLNSVFFDEGLSEKEYYNLLFYDELRKGNYKFILGDFVDNFFTYTRNITFSATEKKLFSLILPADVLIRYLFDGEDFENVVDSIISQIYDRETLSMYFSSFLKGNSRLEEYLFYVSDYRLFKNSYFGGIKKFIVNKFKDKNNYDIEDEIDDFISQVGESDSIENVKIPDRIKKESALMERFINFYITYVGGLWIARGDNFYIRFFKRNILEKILKSCDLMEMKQDALFFYGGLLYNYSKNVFYYKYAFENVRAGKETFSLPFRATFKEVYSNGFIIKLFDENFICNILQDINHKDIKIYIQNKAILETFKETYLLKISKFIKLEKKFLIKEVYSKVSFFLNDIKNLEKILDDELDAKDISNIKESFYTLDFWFWLDFLDMLQTNNLDLSIKYSDFSILGILGTVRDTLFGFALFLRYLQMSQLEFKTDMKIYSLLKIYIVDILCVSEDYLEVCEKSIYEFVDKYHNIIDKWMKIDDNGEYLRLGKESWINFVDNKSEDKVFSDISGEDIIWFRGFLKNITFYNKRYLISKD